MFLGLETDKGEKVGRICSVSVFASQSDVEANGKTGKIPGSERIPHVNNFIETQEEGLDDLESPFQIYFVRSKALFKIRVEILVQPAGGK